MTKDHKDVGAAVVPIKKPMTRADLLGTVFSDVNMRRKTEIVNFCGVDVEVRQPLLKEVFAEADRQKADRAKGVDDSERKLIIKVLLEDTYIPGTEEHLFDESHVDSLSSMPYSKSFTDLLRAYERLSGGGNIEEKVKN